MIAEMTLFTLALAGLCWLTLVAHNRGIAEPFAMIGRRLMAFGIALEEAIAQFRQAYADTHRDIRTQFPPSKGVKA